MNSLLKQFLGHSWLMAVDRIRKTFSLRKMIQRTKPPEHYLGFLEEGRVPIVLIQGYGGSWQHISHLGDSISLEGYPVHIVEKLSNNLRDVPSSAKIVKEHLEKEGVRGAVIVAHSKGGLIGKYLLAHLNKDNRVKGMVAIAAPFNGTAVVKLFRGADREELDVDSELIIDLQRHIEVNDRIISIFPRQDDTIWHEKGSYLEGALDNIMLNNRGHSRPLFSHEGKKAVLEAIERLSKKF